MQRNGAPSSFSNRQREAKDTQNARSASLDFTVHLDSTVDVTDYEPMETHDSSSPNLIPSYTNHLQNATRPLSRSDARSRAAFHPQHEPLFNGHLLNDHHSASQASGFDADRLAKLDADEAYALQLQQEEYSRESLRLPQHSHMRFDVDDDDDDAITLVPPVSHFDDHGQFFTDADIAAQLQLQDARHRGHHRRVRATPPSFIQASRLVHGGSSEALGADDGDVIPISTSDRFAERDFPSGDESREQLQYFRMHNPLFQFFANHGRHFPPGYRSSHIHRGRGSRRGGNLQDNEDDFGPEDYERLLQLDEAVHKKKLRPEQINSIATKMFTPTSNRTDEENKCCICLEQFEANQTLRQLPCSHCFHVDCADNWLKENNVCPICREVPIKVQSTGHHRSRRPPANPGRSTNSHRTNSNRSQHHSSNTHPQNNRGAGPHR